MKVWHTIAHNITDLATDPTTNKLVAQSSKQKVAQNMSMEENWQGAWSNNGLFSVLRERFLDSKDSPAFKYDKKKNMSTITETQQGVGNRYSNFRGNIRVARDSLKSKNEELQSALAAKKAGVEASGGTWSDDMAKPYMDSITANTKELRSLGNKDMFSYVQQAGAHTWRMAKWTQEGSGLDRLKKTAAVGATWGASNIAMRGMTGGGVTYNNDGERDIAGIPFL